MKKKLLFVCMSLGLGGSERCMLEMLRNMDKDRYDITLLALIPVENRNQIPDGIQVINGYEGFAYFNLPLRQFVPKTLRTGNLGLLAKKILYWYQVTKQRKEFSICFWNIFSKKLTSLAEKFHAVVGYGTGLATFFAIEKVPNADKKILWLNTDLEKAQYDISYLRRFYEEADAVFADSQNGVNNLNRLFPKQKNTFFFPNMLDLEGILKKSKAYVPEYLPSDSRRLLSVGRLCEAKAFHLAISAAAILKQRQFTFTWYILGDGSLREELEAQICSLNLQDTVVLLGKRENPYPWFAKCDLYVQTSIYEGSCMTINEAMQFYKPVVTTNFPAAYEKVRHGKNGLICEMTPEDIADKITALLTDDMLCRKISDELKMHPLSFAEAMGQLEHILDA